MKPSLLFLLFFILDAHHMVGGIVEVGVTTASEVALPNWLHLIIASDQDQSNNTTSLLLHYYDDDANDNNNTTTSNSDYDNNGNETLASPPLDDSMIQIEVEAMDYNIQNNFSKFFELLLLPGQISKIEENVVVYDDNHYDAKSQNTSVTSNQMTTTSNSDYDNNENETLAWLTPPSDDSMIQIEVAAVDYNIQNNFSNFFQLLQLPGQISKIEGNVVVYDDNHDDDAKSQNTSNQMTTAADSGATDSCSSGYFKSGGICSICPWGFWCEQGTTTTMVAQACPLGTASALWGATSNQTCVPCPMSHHTAAAGATACSPCPSGFYCPSSAAVLACPEHTVSPQGATAALECRCLSGYECKYGRRLTFVFAQSANELNHNDNNELENVLLQAIKNKLSFFKEGRMIAVVS
jgi:hypothetical protein